MRFNFLGLPLLVLATARCGGAAEPPSRDAAPKDLASSSVRVPGDDAVFAPNPSGIALTVTPTGSIDTSGPFFQNLGANGRACVSCHVAAEGWTVTPAGVRRRFQATGGRDPIFRPNDGSTSPLADVSTVQARRRAYAMLIDKGLIRVGLPILADFEFELAAVDDPYGFASSNELSLFRRPLPATNLTFLSAVMWDGRETLPGMSIDEDLAHQANGATQGHAQRPDPISADLRRQIVAFEKSTYFAQALDFRAGILNLGGATGGARNLSETPFHLGINDTFGADPTGAPFDPVAMRLFYAWSGVSGGSLVSARAAVARGEAIFNGKPIAISGVRGLNDAPGMGTVQGTCTSCHNAPNVGDHSLSLPLDLGLTDENRRTPDLPLYTLRNKATGEIFKTTDPGRALITGKWSDRSRFKGPVLRGLAARAPYFHNGSAATLLEAVDFYDTRFGIGFSAQEKADLVAFLGSL